MKNFFAGIILIALCAYAAYREMQTLAIVSIVLLIGMMYRKHVLKGLEIAFDIARSARQAKFGEFELEIGRDDIENSIINHIYPQSDWVKAIISELDSDHLGLILTIEKAGKYSHLGGIKDKLRDLRSKGLLNHDKETMKDSREVWLTELGLEVARIISKAEAKKKSKK